MIINPTYEQLLEAAKNGLRVSFVDCYGDKHSFVPLRLEQNGCIGSNDYTLADDEQGLWFDHTDLVIHDDGPTCPHCGSTKDPWFSRSEPIGYYCEDCGKDVDMTPEEYASHDDAPACASCAELREVLKDVEWFGHAGCCPICGRSEEGGHAKTCRIARLLKEDA